MIGLAEYELIFITLYIIATYIAYRPNNIFHPNNVVFAFSFLYVCMPTVIYYIYEIYNIDYVLPWGKLYEWDKLSKMTYYYMFYMFFVPFFCFYFFTKNIYNVKFNQKYIVKPSFLVVLVIVLIVLVFVYVYRTGGIYNWLFDYQYTYLARKSGSGLFNVLILFIGDVVIFLLGLKILELKFNTRKVLLILLSYFIICIIPYIQGLKSRLVFLLLLFMFSLLLRLKLSNKNIIIIGILFMLLISFGNYLRSDGFYDSWGKMVEYVMSYFNAYCLHDMVIEENDLNLFQTIHHIFVKPLIMVGLLPYDTDYDISVMLTKQYFPEQWYLFKATLQWPLSTELHINYYGMLLGWMPIMAYSYIVSFLYNKMVVGRIEFSIIYLIEMIRIFATLRGTLSPWILPLDIVFYFAIYFIIKRSVCIEKTNI